MHESVDLQLGFVECIGRRIDHVAVDDLAHSRVERDLFWTQYGYIVFVDEACLLLDYLRILLIGLQLLARHPEQHVLFAVLGAQEFSKVEAATFD